jgi:hypothetical protein
MPSGIMQLFNINHEIHTFRINILIHFFLSVFDVFYLFRTSLVQHQEDSYKRKLYKVGLYGMFVWYVYIHRCKLSSRLHQFL